MRGQSARAIRNAISKWVGNESFVIRLKSSTATTKRTTTKGKTGSGPVFMEGPIPLYNPTPEEAARTARRNVWIALALLTGAGGAYATTLLRFTPVTVKPPQEEHLVNWSGTHECTVDKFYQPESEDELEALVRQAHANAQKLRCVGSGLSPNAIAFDRSGMVSLGLLDKVLSIDPTAGTATVQAGARVQDVADALRPYGLTLPNYASIREQTIGGFTQVSAHGTGASIPPVDEMITAMKLITPASGTLQLSNTGANSELFRLARVGLGCLGIVSELTLRCVPAHKLVERTFVATPAEVRRHHAAWLKENKHLRYMWIPGTDVVVVVQCNEANGEDLEAAETASLRADTSIEYRLAPMRELLREQRRRWWGRRGGISRDDEERDNMEEMSMTQLRDALLAESPLDYNWVQRVNEAEAEYWRRSAGVRVGWSDEILGFDCGGQQWVLEVAFPSGTIEAPSNVDIEYMMDVLAEIKRHRIAAPAPIEQRWSSGSSSPMSPAAGSSSSVFSWVGIIMYLSDNEGQRRRVTSAFQEYVRLMQRTVMKKYHAVEHWAKIEVPSSEKELEEMRARLAGKYPLNAFAEARRNLDPNNVLGNDVVDTLLSPA